MFPPVLGWHDGIDLSSLDPEDEGDREALILAEHPDMAAGLGEGPDSVVGEPNLKLHLAVHRVVASQIWNDDPPETWATARRLSALRYDRHEVLHMVGSAVAEQLYFALAPEATFDHGGFVAALDALPGSWEAQRNDVLDGDDPDEDDPDEDHRTIDIRSWPGITFTHRLTEAEAVRQILVWSPDLEPLGPLLEACDHLHLTDDRVAEPEVDDELGPILAGPPGWLDGFAVGDLVGLLVAEDDEIEVRSVSGTTSSAEVGIWFRTAFDEGSDGDAMPVTVAELVEEAIADRAWPALVLPPVGEVIHESGFEIRFGHVAPAGTDWEAFAQAQLVAVMAIAHGLDVAGARTYVMVFDLYRRFLEDESALPDLEKTRQGMARVLADPDIGPAFVALATVISGDEDLAGFARALAAGVRRRDRAGLTWIEAGALARQGEHLRAEALLQEALDIDPEHPGAIEEAAWYANDRGNARRAVELLGRLDDDAEADLWIQALQPYAASPPAALVRRNEPCPCGSGRKHKYCCLGADRALPLPDRVGWVWIKLEWFVTRSGWEIEVDEVLATLPGDDKGAGSLAVSLVLFLDGAIDDFLHGRGPVLPDDERNLVTQWALVERSVHEVVEVAPNVGLVLRDVRNGEVAQVRERMGSTRMAVGDLLFAHVVPDGHTHQMVGGVVPVPLRLRDPLVALLDDDEVDALDVAELIARAFAPPELRNTEGEPTVLHEVRYRVAQPDALKALDAVLDRDDDGLWSQSTEADGRTWVRGTVAVDGDELVASANSDVRIARLRRVVEEAVFGLALVSASAQSPAELLADRSRPALPLPARDLPPGAADVLASFLHEQEHRWVDESLPALDGLTPRQAAADPTRREQLIALLHDFDREPTPPGMATFDTARLRARLGLDEP